MANIFECYHEDKQDGRHDPDMSKDLSKITDKALKPFA